jgi:predicted HTH domain antitoxin
MQIVLDIPDEIVPGLQKAGNDLSREALESFALHAYKENRITAAQLRRLLGFSTRYELDGFLKQHQIWLDYTLEDLRHDEEVHRRLGISD